MPEVFQPGTEPAITEGPKAREPISLKKYFEQELAEGKIDFALRAAETEDGYIYFYIHPQGKDGDTRDFYLDAADHAIPVNAPGPLKQRPTVPLIATDISGEPKVIAQIPVE